MIDFAPTDSPVFDTGVRPSDLRLSVLTPTFRHEARPLIEGLSRARQEDASSIEFVLVDDGSNDPALAARHQAALAAAPFRGRLAALPKNAGRAGVRNRLLELAEARHVLFLDADMTPKRADFLRLWLDLIAAEDPPSAFGGYCVEDAPHTRATALHRYLSARSDCKPAAERARHPALFAATSNLLVRKDVLAATPFDDGFVGWGWEDVDWGLRAQAFGPVRQIDNPATHLGLDTLETLLRKYREAGPNYARLIAKHPDAAARFPSYRAARIVSLAPGQRFARPLLALIARDPLGLIPMRLRAAALKAFRTSIYAEHAFLAPRREAL